MTHYRRWFHLGFTVPIAMLTLGCMSSSPQEVVTLPSAPPPDVVPHQREANDVARFIAGLPGTDGSAFADLETSDVWKEHRRALDNTWHRAETSLIGGLREFQEKELSEASRDATVFYPFGGPDALTVALCFPHSPAYVLVGLEPPGTLPGFAQIEKRNLPKYLGDVRDTMASELGRSFFITRQMDQQFRGQVTDGLLLPILHLLVRIHQTILGFRYVRLDENGQVIERDPDEKLTAKFWNRGVEIEFGSDADESIHRLYYFSVNLSDQRLRENHAFLAYYARLNAKTTMFKATSYMTHRPDFSVIRNLVLANSTAILQDDSGIPYRFFNPDRWNTQLYGTYVRPYGSFRWLEQADLRKAYGAPGAKPLAIRIGYGYSRVPSNLLLAQRASTSAQVQNARGGALNQP